MPVVASEELRITAARGKERKRLFSITIKPRKGEGWAARSFLCDPREFGRDLFDNWEWDCPRLNKAGLAAELRSRLRHVLKSARETRDRSVLAACAGLDSKLWDLYSMLTQLNQYNIVPEVARGAMEPLPFAYMRPNGAGLSEVVYALEEGLFHRLNMPYYGVDWPSPYGFRRHARMLFLRSEFTGYLRPRELRKLEGALEHIQAELTAGVRPIDAITTKMDPTTGKRFVVFRAGKEQFYPEEVSDGTVKWLSILVSIFVPQSRVYVLEEPENFLHPWMQQKLVSIMREQADKSGTIFLLATHSSTVLNAARPEEILIVTPSRKGASISEIPNRQEIEQVLLDSDFGLGDLWVSGAISGVPSHAE